MGRLLVSLLVLSSRGGNEPPGDGATLLLLKLVNKEHHVEIIDIILYMKSVHVPLNYFCHVVRGPGPFRVRIRGSVNGDFTRFVLGEGRKRLKHGNDTWMVPIAFAKILNDGARGIMEDKPVLVIDTHKAIAEIPFFVLPNTFRQCFFEQSQLEIEARFTFTIFFGDWIDRRHECDGADGLGQSDSADCA